MDWDKLRIFHAVADAGSLTHAGDHLNLSQSAISRQIRALEQQLDCTLFHRHARGLILTEQGELLFDATRSMTGQIDRATAQIRDSADEVYGRLRVTTTIAFGTLWLAPRLKQLYAAHPDMRIDLILAEGVLDLPMREADVAIRMKEPSQADLVRKRLMTVHMQLFATQAYVETYGMPASIEEFGEHRLICQHVDAAQVSAGAELVTFLLSHPISRILTLNNYFGTLQAVRSDLGIGVLPNYVTRDFSNLVRVLPDIQSDEVPVYLAYPFELRHSRRVGVFRDFVNQEIIAYRRATNS